MFSRFEMKSSQLPTSSQNLGQESNMKCKCSGIPWQKIPTCAHWWLQKSDVSSVSSPGSAKRQEDTPARKHDCHTAEGSSEMTEALVMTLKRNGQSSVRQKTKYALVSFENRIASKSFAAAVLRRHSILLFCRMTFQSHCHHFPQHRIC